MATHSSTLAWRAPWTEAPGRPQVMDGVAESDSAEHERSGAAAAPPTDGLGRCRFPPWGSGHS